MKIGILTLHNADNYGAVLQNYALQKAIEGIGLMPITIDYHCDAIDGHYILHYKSISGDIIKKTIHLFFWLINYPQSYQRKLAFQQFRKNKLTLSEPFDRNNIDKAENLCDCFICGSDQIWNPDIIKDNEIAYTLGFVSHKPKSAFAASAGKSSIDNYSIIELIRHLKYITVREPALQEYLNSIGVLGSKVVCDPVFLLSREKWLVCTSSLHPKGQKSIFLYYVEDESRTLCSEIAQDIANGRQVLVPAVFSRTTIKYKQKRIYNEDPLLFVAEIACSEMIVTSSFHAVAFSILLNRPFIAFPCGPNGQRLLDLLKTVGMQDRIITSFADYLQKKEKLKLADFSKANIIVDKLRNQGLKALNYICRIDSKNE